MGARDVSVYRGLLQSSADATTDKIDGAHRADIGSRRHVLAVFRRGANCGRVARLRGGGYGLR